MKTILCSLFAVLLCLSGVAFGQTQAVTISASTRKVVNPLVDFSNGSLVENCDFYDNFQRADGPIITGGTSDSGSVYTVSSNFADGSWAASGSSIIYIQNHTLWQNPSTFYLEPSVLPGACTNIGADFVFATSGASCSPGICFAIQPAEFLPPGQPLNLQGPFFHIQINPGQWIIGVTGTIAGVNGATSTIGGVGGLVVLANGLWKNEAWGGQFPATGPIAADGTVHHANVCISGSTLTLTVDNQVETVTDPRVAAVQGNHVYFEQYLDSATLPVFHRIWANSRPKAVAQLKVGQDVEGWSPYLDLLSQGNCFLPGAAQFGFPMGSNSGTNGLGCGLIPLDANGPIAASGPNGEFRANVPIGGTGVVGGYGANASVSPVGCAASGTTLLVGDPPHVASSATMRVGDMVEVTYIGHFAGNANPKRIMFLGVFGQLLFDTGTNAWNGCTWQIVNRMWRTATGIQQAAFFTSSAPLAAMSSVPISEGYTGYYADGVLATGAASNDVVADGWWQRYYPANH